MARAAKVGRNDPCPCGSGRKFKHCCEGKAGGLSFAGWAAIAAMLVAAAVVLVFVYNLTQGETVPSSGSCPPGQVWSPEHGHCHDL